MPLNHYVTLGHSGLRVSPFCLGAMTFGEELGWGSSVKDSGAILDHFIERGGNFIDTANVYTRGHSEKIIGDHIGRHASRRGRVVIATKFFGNLHTGTRRRRGEPQGHLPRVRRLPPPPADGLHRPVLDARLGPVHAYRGDDERPR